MTALLKKRTVKTADAATPVTSVVADAPGKSAKTPAKQKKASLVGTERDILLEPYLTEKSSTIAEHGQYTFLVRRDAEKTAIARAVAQRFGVHPIQVRIVRTSGKFVRYGKTSGRRSDQKKAIIRLRAGETMPFGARS